MLEFMDCPHCGKRIRKDAARCHKCGFLVIEALHPSSSPQLMPATKLPRNRSNDGARNGGKAEGESEQAANFGGYDASADDFDYEEFLEEEFGKPKKKKKFWYYVAWVVIASLVFPIVLQVLRLFGA